jgi:hypothetical protein
MKELVLNINIKTVTISSDKENGSEIRTERVYLKDGFEAVKIQSKDGISISLWRGNTKIWERNDNINAPDEDKTSRMRDINDSTLIFEAIENWK